MMPLQIQNISLARQNQVLFQNINMELHAGEFLLLQGANGSGKSSLLRILAGLVTPTSGNILWQQQPIENLRHELHYCGHSNGIKLDLTVAENLNHPDIEKICGELKLTSTKTTRLLSAGQKRKVALARLFLFPKKLWLLDEPLTALDAATQEIFFVYLNKHLNNGGICVLSSHQSLVIPNMQQLRLGC